MEPQQFQPQYVANSGLSPETEKLLNKWLKMQIGQFYWGMFTKIVLFILIVASLVFSTFTLAPFVQSQLGMLQTVQSTINSLSSGTYGAQPIHTKTDTQPASINDIIRQLTPEQKALLIEQLEQSQ